MKRQMSEGDSSGSSGKREGARGIGVEEKETEGVEEEGRRSRSSVVEERRGMRYAASVEKRLGKGGVCRRGKRRSNVVPLNGKRDTKGEERGRRREGAKDKGKERRRGREEEDERRPMSAKEMEEADASRYRADENGKGETRGKESRSKGWRGAKMRAR